MRQISNLGIAILAASGAALAAPTTPAQERPKVRRAMLAGYDASINPRTGKPHSHSREIERRLRQQARKGGGA